MEDQIEKYLGRENNIGGCKHPLEHKHTHLHTIFHTFLLLLVFSSLILIPPLSCMQRSLCCMSASKLSSLCLQAGSSSGVDGGLTLAIICRWKGCRHFARSSFFARSRPAPCTSLKCLPRPSAPVLISFLWP